jgi:hypothetical protein
VPVAANGRSKRAVKKTRWRSRGAAEAAASTEPSSVRSLVDVDGRRGHGNVRAADVEQHVGRPVDGKV